MTDKEQRAADQDTAIEKAFIAGTLPEDDRRHAEDEAEIASLKERIVELEFAVQVRHASMTDLQDRVGEGLSKIDDLEMTTSILESAGVGSTFTKAAHGWDVKYVDGGTVLLVQGATISDALSSHGNQFEHPAMQAGPIIHPKIGV